MFGGFDKKHLTMASTRTPKSVTPIVGLLFGAGYAKRWAAQENLIGKDPTMKPR